MHSLLQAMDSSKCVGAIVCKLDIHRKVVKRGYIAMLAVDEKYRKKKIGKNEVEYGIVLWSLFYCRPYIKFSWQNLEPIFRVILMSAATSLHKNIAASPAPKIVCTRWQ